MKMVEEVLSYETPMVEILEVEVEKGFAASPEDDGNVESPEYGGNI